MRETINCVEKDVVIIGNGPSGISLSAMLAGHVPYLKTTDHPDEMLAARLNTVYFDKSLAKQPLEEVALGLEGRSTNPVSLLLDALEHPYADLGFDLPSLLEWNHCPDQEIDHVVIGKGPPGGSWHTMDPNILTLSLGSWMSLPGLPFQQSDCSDSQRRASAGSVAKYYENYVEKMNLNKYFINDMIVLNVELIKKENPSYGNHEILNNNPNKQMEVSKRKCSIINALNYIRSRTKCHKKVKEAPFFRNNNNNKKFKESPNESPERMEIEITNLNLQNETEKTSLLPKNQSESEFEICNFCSLCPFSSRTLGDSQEEEIKNVQCQNCLKNQLKQNDEWDRNSRNQLQMGQNYLHRIQNHLQGSQLQMSQNYLQGYQNHLKGNQLQMNQNQLQFSPNQPHSSLNQVENENKNCDFNDISEKNFLDCDFENSTVNNYESAIKKLCCDSLKTESESKTKWLVHTFNRKTNNFQTFCSNYLVLANGASDLPNQLGLSAELYNFSWVLHDLRSLETQLDSLMETSGKKDPVLVVGAGLSAADAVIATRFRNIPVLHVFRNKSVSLDKQLPENMYPEYHKVHQMMLDGGSTYPLYTSLPEFELTDISEDHQVTLTSKNGMDKKYNVSFVVILIGSRPDLGFLPKNISTSLGSKKKLDNIDAKTNPIDINKLTHLVNGFDNLYALGPITGDHFVRFIPGGALAITSDLYKKKNL